MKLKLYFTLILLSFSLFIFSQKNEYTTLLVNVSRTVSLQSPGFSYQYPEPTYELDGIDMKMLFKTNLRNVSVMAGSTFLMGGNQPNESTTYGGGCYLGPYLSLGNKWIKPWAYIGLGVFSFHDDIMKLDNSGLINFYQESNFTSVGTKSALGFTIIVKSLSFNIGYQIFSTASENTTLLQHGLETGIGIQL